MLMKCQLTFSVHFLEDEVELAAGRIDLDGPQEGGNLRSVQMPVPVHVEEVERLRDG